MTHDITVVGAGLAGSEAAWQLANMGLKVRLIEMKPEKKTPAHQSDLFGELVCSNSLRGDSLANAIGLLKEELRHLNSLILRCAEENRVEAGGALAVDRVAFAAAITKALEEHENIEIVHQELTEIPEGPAIIATGPLTSDAMADAISEFFGGAKGLNFYDAAAPLVSFESLDMDHCWFASRYDKGTADYINCAMDRQQYLDFVRELSQAEEAAVHGFEDKKVFEGCMPVEVMARRGEDTLRYGPLKPVGLKDPKTGKEPYAVVQLRKDNRTGTVYNIVGFQTHLRWPEQKRVFSMIPALKNAEYPLWSDAPEHLSGFPPAAGSILPGAKEPEHCLCRTDDGSRGLHRVHRLRYAGGTGNGTEHPWKAAGGFSHLYGDRRIGGVHQRRKRREIPAHERKFRHY